ncbi:MAG TPA: hypothetical protein VHB73_01545 [Alphaproteobacteria bacterium]|nr:hypothetical protein [Alphaproteobacteria bacterium]
MGFAYPLAMPSSPAPTDIQFMPEVAAGESESEFSFEDQQADWGGRRWRLNLTYPSMLRPQAEEWMAFFLMCEGPLGTFFWGPPNAYAARGNWGTPLVDGASQTGNALNIKGLSNSDASAVKIGDWCQIGVNSNARLFKNVANAASDGSGKAALSLWPAIVSAPADSAAIVTANPKGVFKLAGSNQGFKVNKLLHGFSLEILSIPG